MLKVEEGRLGPGNRALRILASASVLLSALSTLPTLSSSSAHAQRHRLDPLSPHDILSQGFGFERLAETGARAIAMGGAFSAIPGDLEAAAWNPAGLASLERAEAILLYESSAFELTETPLRWRLDSSHTDPLAVGVAVEELRLLSEDQSSRQSDIGFLAAAWPVKLHEDLSLVVAVTAQRGPEPQPLRRSRSFAYVFDVDDLTPARHLGSLTETTVAETSETRVSGGSEILALSLALQPTRRLRLGVGVHYLTWDTTDVTHYTSREEGTIVAVSSDTPMPVVWPVHSVFDRKRERSLSFSDWQAEVGMQIDLGSRWTLGAAYRSGFRTGYRLADTLEVEQTGFDFPDPASVSSEAELEWPSSWKAGIAFVHRLDCC